MYLLLKIKIYLQKNIFRYYAISPRKVPHRQFPHFPMLVKIGQDPIYLLGYFCLGLGSVLILASSANL